MRICPIALLCAVSLTAQVRPIPPPGIAVPDADHAALEAGLAKLHASTEALHANALYADVAIFEKAVRYALENGEFFKPEEIGRAKELLAIGQTRADALLHGEAPWNTATGLVVRGYVSKIDGSVQPYGLVVPPTWFPTSAHGFRLDTWFHGRGETLSEENFLWDRMRNVGEFSPRDTITLHLYGRYCNANKFAGETDLFEALADVKKHYHIDERRLVLRGFSMGGASTWQFATHFAGMWAAAAPGAGFAETPEFVHAKESGYKPEWWEEKLWHWTNATDYAANLYQCPLVAYNGDQDGQKQAADVMERALGEEGMRLSRVTGLNVGHKYTPEAKEALSHIVDALADRGNDPFPRKIRFTTWTLSYNRMKWVVVDALTEHWARARANADIVDDHTIHIETANVDALTLDIGPANALFDMMTPTINVRIDGVDLNLPGPATDRSWTAHLHRQGGKWVAGELPPGLHKSHGLQGPIDDAFLDSFLIVKPSGASGDATFEAWSHVEMDRAIREWRRQFRGDARVKLDTDVTDADIASSNLILWGDASSNKLIAKIAGRLPIAWPGASKALLLVYPNPLNANKYVVLNSGFTFREQQYLNNAWQVARLPDWAVVDLNTPPDANWPGKIIDAGFFDEAWQVKKH